MKQNDTFSEDVVTKEFSKHLETLEELYKSATLKEKHKLNEHIRHILETHVAVDTKELEKNLKS
ncbi:MAG: hypothetical protein JXQ67_01555 [Campylobacterales bacterium]|nr:hypothetical protein [Campylobacterales bacterium]